MASRTYESRKATSFSVALTLTPLVVFSGCAPATDLGSESDAIVGTVSQELPSSPPPSPIPSPPPQYCSGTVGLPSLPLAAKPSQSVSGSISRVAMGDMDGDGDLDLLMSMRERQNMVDVGRIGLIRNNGNGTFAPLAHFDSGALNDALAVADMNNDGIMDALQAGYHSYPRVMLNDGNGGVISTFWQSQSVLLTQADKIVTADLNNDGFKDMLLRESSNSTTLHVALNNGGTAFGLYTKPTFPPFVDFDVVDLNGDGNGDLVLNFSTTNAIQVRNGLGNGTFGSPVDYPYVNAASSFGLRDLNADGKIDLVVSNGMTTAVRFNAGNGTFGAPTTYTGGTADIAHMNGDGKLDIVGPTTLFNNGNGTFTPQIMGYVPSQGGLLGDLNGDGLVDIARRDGAEGLSILLHRGNLGFMRPYTELGLTFANEHQAVSADVTGDNFNDLMIVGVANSAGLRVNLGNGRYAPPVTIPGGSSASVIASADMNGDGYNDLVTASVSTTIGVWFNNGSGTFASGSNYFVAAMPDVRIAVADLNGDGAPDLARVVTSTQTPNTSKLSVMLNLGNGTLGPSIDVGVANGTPIGLFAADTNADGHMDLTVYGTGFNINEFRNNGSGGFTNLNPDPNPLVPEGYSYLIADFNGDDYPDFASSTYSFWTGTHTARIYINNGNGMYSQGPSAQWPDSNGRIVGAVDIDGNGFKDLLILRGNYTLVAHMYSGGTTFTSKNYYLTSADGMLVTDVDDDGVSELITTTGVLHRIKCYP